jgi:hypothetical protein
LSVVSPCVLDSTHEGAEMKKKKKVFYEDFDLLDKLSNSISVYLETTNNKPCSRNFWLIDTQQDTGLFMEGDTNWKSSAYVKIFNDSRSWAIKVLKRCISELEYEQEFYQKRVERFSEIIIARRVSLLETVVDDIKRPK